MANRRKGYKAHGDKEKGTCHMVTRRNASKALGYNENRNRN